MTVSQESPRRDSVDQESMAAREPGSRPADPRGPGRRGVVVAVGAAGLAVALTACGGGSDDDPGPSGTTGEEQPPKEPGEDTGTETGDTTGGGAGGAVLAKTSDIPEGGGTVFKDERVVVTQPTAGQFKAFSSTCTHQGCTVRNVADGTINCPCHGSKFDVADGTVRNGPATQPLPAERITVKGDEITLG